jgi:hypothetical protein
MLGSYKAVGKNPVAAFAVGEILNIVKDKIDIKDRVNELLVQTINESVNVIDLYDPFTLKGNLEGFVGQLKSCALDCGRAIDESSLSDEQKDTKLRHLLSSSRIAQHPQGAVDVNQMALMIELALYLTLLLNNDFLVKIPEHGTGFGVQRPWGDRTPIEASPLDVANYPKPIVPETGFGYFGKQQYIEARRPGKLVENRIDELCLRLLRVNRAYTDGFSAGVRSLGMAQTHLNHMCNALTPFHILVVRS